MALAVGEGRVFMLGNPQGTLLSGGSGHVRDARVRLSRAHPPGRRRRTPPHRPPAAPTSGGARSSWTACTGTALATSRNWGATGIRQIQTAYLPDLRFSGLMVTASRNVHVFGRRTRLYEHHPTTYVREARGPCPPYSGTHCSSTSTSTVSTRSDVLTWAEGSASSAIPPPLNTKKRSSRSRRDMRGPG